MGKEVRKIIIGELIYIQEYEEYFSEMSRKGLHLQRIGKFFIYFKEDKPKYLRYRIDVVNENDNENDKEIAIKNYKEKGWDFVCEKDYFLIFSSPENSNLRELYETPEEQKLKIKAVKEKVFGKKFTEKIMGIMTIIFVVIIFYIKLNKNNIFYATLSYSSLLSAVLGVINFFKSRRQKRILKRLEETLDSGVFLSHQGDYFLMRNKFIIRKTIYFLFLLFVLGNISYAVLNNEKIALNEIKNLENLPVITIDSIEEMESRAEGKLSLSGDNIDYGNIMYKNWSLIIPKDYTLVQSVRLYDEEGKKTQISPHLAVDYYLGRFDFIAKNIMDEVLFKKNKSRSLNLKPIKLEEDLSLYGMDKKDEIILLCRYGKQVVFIRYKDGTVSIEELTDVLFEKLKSNEEY